MQLAYVGSVGGGQPAGTWP